MIKCVIFDLDGTLLNTLPTITYYLNRMHDRFGLMRVSEEMARGMIGNGAKMLIRRSVAAGGGSVDELFDEAFTYYTEDYDKNSSYLTSPYEGIPEMLDELAERGILLTVYTNKPATCAPDVIREIFGERFARVVGADPSRPVKPAPDGGLVMLEELGISPAECAYLGDMTVDSETAKNLGVKLTVLADWGFGKKSDLEASYHDHIISHPSELVSLIDRENGGKE